jgi:hypothetical protein
VVGIVESVKEVFVEGMDILQAWEPIKNGLELLAKRLGGKFDLASVEAWQQYISRNPSETKAKLVTSYPADLKASTNLRGEFPLSSTENDVDELLGGGNRRDLP